MKAEKETIEYLAERAAIFFGYLDSNEILTIFPYRKEAWADLDKRVESGNRTRVKNLNNIIDNTLIGKNSLSIEDRFEILRLFDEKLGESKDTLINKKRKLYDKIVKKGSIASNLVINDAIAIMNSEILGLSALEKERLKEIIIHSARER